MVNIGDTVKAWKSVMYREYSTEGVVKAVTVDQFGDQLAKINNGWYRVANDLENKFEVVFAIFSTGQQVQLKIDPTAIGTITNVMGNGFVTIFWNDEHEGDYVSIDWLKPVQAAPAPQPLAPQYPNWTKLSRQEQNIILKKHGYRWVKYTRKELEDNDDFDREPGWYLFAPDGREVEVERAFNEINRGVEVVKAEIEAKRQAEEADRERRRQVKAGVQKVAEYIQANGEKPENPNWPQGDTLLDSRNIYGSGEAFIIEPDNTVWYLIKNGMDGDDWSRNNLPGHITFKLSAAPVVAEALRQLAAGRPIQGGLL